MKIVASSRIARVALGILILAWISGRQVAESAPMSVILGMAIIMVVVLRVRISIFDLLTGGVPTLIALSLTSPYPHASGLIGVLLAIIVTSYQTTKEVVFGILILAWLCGYPEAQSVLMGVILGVASIKVIELRDRISIFDLLIGGVPTLIALSLMRQYPSASGLTGIVSGLIVTSYILAPGSPNLRQPLGRMLGILIAVLGSYFVSPTWEELVAGLATGVLLTGLLFGVQKQPINHAHHSLVK